MVNYIVDKQNVLEFVKELNTESGTKNIALFGDITKAKDIENIIEEATGEYGQIDILINNAAIRPTSLIKDMADSEWEKVLDVNLNAAFKFSKRIINHFLNHKIKGHIVNIISKAAYSVTSEGHGHYAASKAGMLMLTKALANEVAAYGIIVNGVAPGIIKTSMMEGKLENKSVFEEYLRRIKIGRFAEVQEIGDIVAFLASDKCELVAGACLDISGGMLI